jgi:AcrR family transcriptional regulator
MLTATLVCSGCWSPALQLGSLCKAIYDDFTKFVKCKTTPILPPVELKAKSIVDAAYPLFQRHGFRKVTMSDIAEAAEMSRPTLYAVFPNKEAVFGAIAEQLMEDIDGMLAPRLARATTLEAKLSCIFDAWIIEPFASVIDSPSGLDLLANSASYAPDAVDAHYARFEECLFAALKPELPRKRGLTARDLAHIMSLATRGIKATTTTLAELRRMTSGLITMAVATTRAT